MRIKFILKDIRTFLENNKIWFETIAASLLGIMAILVSILQFGIAQEERELLKKQTTLTEQQMQYSFHFDSLQSIYTRKQTELTDEQLWVIQKESIRKSLNDKKDLKQDIIEIDNLFKEISNQMQYDASSHPAGTSWDQSFFGIRLGRIENLLQKYLNTDLIFKKTKYFDNWLKYYIIVKEINVAIGRHYSVEDLKRYRPSVDSVRVSISVFLNCFK